jgi:hypothetical protein
MNRCTLDDCLQGKLRCKTPLTCSGATEDVEAAISAMRLHRIDHIPHEEDDTPPWVAQDAYAWLDDLMDAALKWFGVAVVVCLLIAAGTALWNWWPVQYAVSTALAFAPHL